jgi:hypothetical protein
MTAIGLSPANAMHWIGLSKTLESKGESEASLIALDRAIQLNPTYEKPRWMKVNLLLGRGSTAEAFSELKLIIDEHPPERSRAFSVLNMVAGGNVELILKEAIPFKQEPVKSYLSFLMWKDNTEGAMIVWKFFLGAFEVSPELSTKYIDYLVSAGKVREASAYQLELRGGQGRAEALLTNGGFEDDICASRLCWNLRRVDGATSRIDDSIFYGGARSLKVEFDGKSNVDFHHVSKVVPLEANRTYLLSASLRADRITTASGLFMEFSGIGGCKFYARSEALTATEPWKSLKIEATTPEGCGAGIIRLRRLKSERLDNLIGGALWVDNVTLKEKGAR